MKSSHVVVDDDDDDDTLYTMCVCVRILEKGLLASFIVVMAS